MPPKILHFGTKIVAATIADSGWHIGRRFHGATAALQILDRHANQWRNARTWFSPLMYTGTKEFAADRSASPSRFKDAYVLYEIETIVRPPNQPAHKPTGYGATGDAFVCFDDGSPRWSSILPMQKRPKRNHRACQITVSYDYSNRASQMRRWHRLSDSDLVENHGWHETGRPATRSAVTCE